MPAAEGVLEVGEDSVVEAVDLEEEAEALEASAAAVSVAVEPVDPGRLLWIFISSIRIFSKA